MSFVAAHEMPTADAPMASPVLDDLCDDLARRRRERERERERRPRPVAAPRIYRGRRQGHRRIVEVIHGDGRPDPRPLNPRLDLAEYSDDLEWAAGQESRLQLALAILADATGSAEIARLWCRDFAAEVVAGLLWQAWELTGEEVHNWLVPRAVAEAEAMLPPARRARRMKIA